ncbi:hypothetical protein BCS42_01805 [Crenothrix sp. D3]|nr:hypothetical protein BCS42_01805 [Crenothrix sp. D3]
MLTKAGIPMNTTYLERIEQEVKQMPPEYLPALLNIIHTFRESVQLNTATQSFQQGWQEALNGETQAIETLWDDLET